MKFKPHIYIPIEIFYREINSRVILALNACLKGYRVYIGTKAGIDNILNYKLKKNLKGGIYLYKSNIISSPNYINKIKKVCDHFVVIDEELTPGVVNLKEIIINRTINEHNISKFFVLGEKIKKQILKYKKNFSSQIIVSGWPKYDVYRKEYSEIYKKETAKIKKKYGNFLLFVSNYGAISEQGLKIHLQSLKKIKKRGFVYQNQIETMKQYFKDFKYMCNQFNIFKKKNEKINIVLRPHPSDYFHDNWNKNLKNLKNFHIAYDKDIIPWIIASRGIIHRGCSTSIDAYFLKKKIFFFLPDRKLKKKEKNLTYDISKKIKKFEELNKLLNKSFKYDNKKAKFINNQLYLNKNKSSSEIIISELKNMDTYKEISYGQNSVKNFLRDMRGYFGFYRRKFKFSNDNYSKTSLNKFPSIMSHKFFKNRVSALFKNKKIKINKISYDAFEFDI